MKVVIQRSKNSCVKVDNNIVGKIEKGLVILVGFTNGDTIEDINYIVKKVLGLRIFEDDNRVMNLSIREVNGEILSISQFTLYGSTKDGNRPSYINAMKGEEAIKLYDKFNELLSENIKVGKGIFGADMEVSIINDGPVTIIIDSKDK